MARCLGARLFFGLEGMVEIFQTTRSICLFDFLGKTIGQLRLRLDGLNYKSFAFGQRPQTGNTLLDSEELFFVEPAG